MRWLDHPKMAVSLALAVLAALVLVGINEAGYRRSVYALSEIDHAHQVRGALNAMLRDVLDAESSQRGYLLTGDARYRAPYSAAVKHVDGQLALLRALYADRPDERARLSVLARHLERKLAKMTMTIQLREDGHDDGWKFVLSTDVGRQEMAAIQSEGAALVSISNRALETGAEQITRAQQLSRLGIALVALAALLAFFLSLRQANVLRLIDQRQKQALQRERNALEKEVRERTASLAELATHLQTVRETERAFLARELHDELGSLLTGAKLDVARLKLRVANLPEATERLAHLGVLLNSGIALKRRIVEDLRPSSLSNLGLPASLEILAGEFAERSGMKIRSDLDPVTLNADGQLTIYRMVQEGLTNIAKYAQATEATIVLKDLGSHVSVELVDNGNGFDTQTVRPAAHGLAGMRHRVEAAEGKLTVRSAPGQGTRLSATLPSGV